MYSSQGGEGSISLKWDLYSIITVQVSPGSSSNSWFAREV